MPRPAPLPDELGESFSCRRARDAGVTPRRLRAGDLEAPHRGVRIVRATPVAKADSETVPPTESRPAPPPGTPTAPPPGTPTAPPSSTRTAPPTSTPTGPPADPEPDQRPLAKDRAVRHDVARRAQAYSEVMGAGAFFVGRTAAVLHRAPIAHDGDLEVGVASPARAPRCRGVRGRKITAKLVHVVEVDGLRVASPASTWAMRGDELTVRELVVLGDAMVRVPRDDRGRRQPAKRLATIAQLRRAATAGKRRGAAKLRDALEAIRVGSMSPLETEYRLDAAEAGLPDCELDVEIRDSDSRLLGISEVVYPAFRTVVEIEGDHHRTSREQWHRDIEKYAAYTAEGWEVVRLTSLHLRGRNPKAPSIVRSVLMRRGWDGRPE